MKRCPACSGYNMDDRESCGLCGSSLVDIESVDDRTEPLPPPSRPIPKMLPGERRNIEAGLLALVIGAGLTFGGILVAANYRTLGLQLTIFGLITLMAVILGSFGGLFSGWRGWYLEMIRRRSFPDEPQEYPVNPDEKQND